MFLRRFQFLIWLSIPLVAYSQYERKGNTDAVEITTESISHQSDTEYEITTLPSNDNQNKSAICNYTNTCGEIDSVAQNFENGQRRLCMCDEVCSAYGDCCSDAKYRNKNQTNFVCTSTFFDGNIYIKNTCQSENNDSISNFCTKYSVDNKIDMFSLIPVTSKSTNITYANFFCALCNNEKAFRFWDTVVIPNFQSTTTISPDVNEVFLYDKFFWDHLDRRATSNYSVHVKIPKSLLPLTRHCIPDAMKHCLRSDPAGNACFDISVDNSNGKNSSHPPCFSNNIAEKNIPTIKAKNIPFQYCEITPVDSSAFRMLCQKQSDSNKDPVELTYIDNCFFQTVDGDLCLINSFFKSHEFQIIDSETVYVPRYGSNFSSSEWSLEGNSSLYLCGTKIPQSPKDRFFSKINNLLSTVLISTSILFLALYIIMYNNVKKLRYPFSRVILCYSVTLLITFVLFLTADWVSSCKTIAALLHYFFLSCFTWLMVASYECWRTVTAPTSASTRNKNDHTWTRFGVYCVLGWGLPISVLLVAIYFELSPVQSVPCPLKPGYGRLNQCFIAQLLPSFYFFHYPSWILFLINIYFFVHISIYVFCNSSVHRNFSIFAKLALVTGIPWTLGTLVTLTNGMIILKLIYVILNSSQGIFIYFVFGYDKEVITSAFNKLRNCYLNNSEERGNGAVIYKVTTVTQASHTAGREYL